MNDLTRRAVISSNSWNPETREIEAIASTFADVRRMDGRGAYLERLDPKTLDLSGIDGLPLLDGHSRNSARDILGHVRNARIEDGKLIVRLHLSSASDVADAVTKIIEGSLRGVSIGYSVNKWNESSESNSRIRAAADWRINEVSAVAVPADRGAQFRNQEMTDTNTTETTDTRAARREEMEREAEQQPRIRAHVRTGGDDAMTRRAEALACRMAGDAPSDGAREFMSDSLRDHARAAVEAAGISTRGLSTEELFRSAMHTTSDFPELLTGAGRRVLRGAYDAAQSPLKGLSRKTTHADFRGKSILGVSGIGTLERVSEAGEIKHKSRAETTMAYNLDTFGALFSISRKALINDDLGAFSDWARAAGRAAAETEARVLVETLLNTAGVFTAPHGNLMTGSALDIDALSAARLALRTMTAEDGTPIGATPRYLLVGPELETDAEKLLASIYAATASDVNPFSQKLTLLVEPRITDDSFYVFAAPSNVPFMEHAYLSGAEGPQISQREGWEVLSKEWRVTLDFGAAIVDWRGAVKNPGVA